MTGMADPAPVAQTFLVHEAIAEFARLDGIVTLVITNPNPNSSPNPNP